MTTPSRRRLLGAALLPAASAALEAWQGNPASVALVGAGNRGFFHLQNLVKLPGVRIVAVCDTNPENLKAALDLVSASGQPAPRGYADWKEMLKQDDIRVVVSALPIDLHARNYLDVIAAGKDLYAEKPLALTRTDCDAVVDAASKGDSVVMVGFQRRADQRVIETVSAIHGGEIGQLVEGRILWSNVYGPMGGWYGYARRSGDWMVEQACHNWDVINWVNECRPVLAVGLGRNDLFRQAKVLVDVRRNKWEMQSGRDVHEYYSAVVQYENGMLVNILHSWISPKLFSGEYTRVVGTAGGADLNTGTLSWRTSENRADRPAGVDRDAPNRDVAALLAFLESVRSRKAPPATLENAREAVLTSLLVREAVYTRRPVPFQEILAKP